jgi:hypothetical protein
LPAPASCRRWGVPRPFCDDVAKKGSHYFSGSSPPATNRLVCSRKSLQRRHFSHFCCQRLLFWQRGGNGAARLGAVGGCRLRAWRGIVRRRERCRPKRTPHHNFAWNGPAPCRRVVLGGLMRTAIACALMALTITGAEAEVDHSSANYLLPACKAYASRRIAWPWLRPRSVGHGAHDALAMAQ